MKHYISATSQSSNHHHLQHFPSVPLHTAPCSYTSHYECCYKSMIFLPIPAAGCSHSSHSCGGQQGALGETGDHLETEVPRGPLLLHRHTAISYQWLVVYHCSLIRLHTPYSIVLRNSESASLVIDY